MNAPPDQQRKLVRLDKLLLKTALADSATDGQRKIKQNAVQINERVANHPHLLVLLPTPDFTLRVGRKIKRVSLQA
jgi:ribosomal protein S4